MNPRLDVLREKARRLPLTPGVYIMKNPKEQIIYIGKAKALRNRVSQYFGAGNQHTPKVRRMVEQVQDFDYILTDSEYEALVLECSLIKQYMPKYNILLKDDKGYHYVRVTKGPWSRISEAKQMAEDGSLYLGPYTSGWTVKQAVDEANKIFGLPTCSRRFPQEIGKGRPCLNFFIKQCCAPCRGKISAEEYEDIVEEAVDFLKGGKPFSKKELTQRMEQAAENLEFEKAARLRDRIQAIERVSQKQKVVMSRVPVQDVIAMARVGEKAAVEVFRFTNGRLHDQESFLLGEIDTEPEARQEFVERYYTMRPDAIPPVIAMDEPAEDMELLGQWLSERAGRKVTLQIPQRGEQRHLVDMCRANAAEKLAQDVGRTGKEVAALEELGRLLGLDSPPRYIESYDISNTAGSDNVGAMVVFEDGRPLKSAYRKFAIKGFEGQDDYASLYEVLSRRFHRYEEEKETGEGFGRLPDLILMDGGKGQVSAVLPVIREHGLDVPVFGMVKDDKHRTRAITSEGAEIAIAATRSVFTLVSDIQEEVHRFAIGYHRQKRSKSAISSTLQGIPGIGPARAKALLRTFGTVGRVKEATEEELSAVKGMNAQAAKAVRAYFDGEDF
ncbi:UvrABC system protein C [Eubacteriaceae bacterium CHKCI005]|uniref:UvrABC system protein C n=1 Tax=Solibaculum mannosilyticum TaxID=2780922 RepID=A0A7I8CZY8_9FIRM|nr:excinuclease ABC subunit UvrC [Solibaculum mannosilyticum]BCI60016.1 UvrABC system protein C [Solibaculum mannosilyticum]CZT57370.1 UvrABC system protein C [Eubacteriaceae bacterium CHKCI005]